MTSEADAEVLQRALQNFKPLVFSLISGTRENVNTERILEGLKKDEALQDSLLVIDARLCVREFPAAKALNGKGSKGNSEPKRNHAQAETGKSPPAFVREEYVKIALAREHHQMVIAKERENYRRSLQEQYVEDGLTEEEALKAAEEDMKEEDDTAEEVDVFDPVSSGSNKGEKIKRSPLYLCVLGFPNSMQDLLECAANEVPLHCLLNVTSKAPTSESIAMGAMEKPVEKAKSKSNEVAKNAGKRAKASEDDGIKHFLQELYQRKEEMKKTETYSAVDEVLVHEYEFLTDVVPPRNPDVPSSYRLVGNEKASLHSIAEALVEIEDSLFLFSEWKAKRAVVHVPKYTGLPNPDAPKLLPVEVVEEKNKKGGKIASKKSVQLSPEPVVQMPVLTTEDLRKMSDVAACREQYDNEMQQFWMNHEMFSVSAFVESCIAQVSVSTAILADKNAKTEKEMLNEKSKVGRFADFIFREILGKVNFYQECNAMLLKKRGKVLEELPRVERKELISSSAEGLLSSQVARKESVEVLPSKEFSSTEAKKNSVSVVPSSGQLLGAEGNDIEKIISAENLREIMITAIKTLYPFLSNDTVNELVEKGSFFAFAAINQQHLKASFFRFWFYKNMLAWRPFSRVWNNFLVDVASKGDGSSRTQQIVHSFDGPTTFPDFYSEQKFCEGEKLFFYPPAVESDDEMDIEDEEIEEEDEEDEEGTIIPRKKKDVDPHPFLDHITIIQKAMRRRRIYETVLHHLSSPSNQESVSHGLGSRHASEEVEWMFPPDGAIIEVDRSVANTKQVHCMVCPPRGIEFGFLFEEPCRRSEDVVLESVPSCIRSFVDVGRVVQIRAEVVADNSVEAEKKAYEKSVEEAKIEAKKQLEALQLAKKSAKGKDKAAILPTLQELEQGCIDGIPKPETRQKCPPTLQISALFLKGSVVVTFYELEERLLVKPFQPILNVNLPVRVWRSNRVDTIILHAISHLSVQVEFIELFSPQSQGYRILLSQSGTYITEKDNQSLVITCEGDCTLRSVEGIVVLPSLQLSKNVDPSTKNVVVEREDGVKFIYQGERKERIHFGCNVKVTHEGRECSWVVAGLPIIKSNVQERVFGIDGGVSVLRFDLSKNVGYLMCPHEEYYAVIDWIEYRLHVVPIDNTSHYTIDCAFGGIYGEVLFPTASTEKGKKIYRVSPFGRCSEEQDGFLVHPKGYITPERQPLMRLLEVWDPLFVKTLQGTDVCVDRDALHLLESLDQKRIVSSFKISKWIHPGGSHKAIERFLVSQCASSLKRITESNESDRRILTCVSVCTSERSIFLVFMEPSCTFLVTKSFLLGLHPLYSSPIEVQGTSPEIREFLMAVKAPQWGLTKSSKALLPSTVDGLFHSQSKLSPTMLYWFWLIRASNGNTFDHPFFCNFFNSNRIDHEYQNALAVLSSNLPLAQRDYLISHRKASEKHKVELIGGIPSTDGAASDGTTRKDEKENLFLEKKVTSPSRNVKVESQFVNTNGRLSYWKSFTGEILPEKIQKADISLTKKTETHDRGTSSTNVLLEKTPEKSTLHTQNPLMISKSLRSSLHTGTTAATRNHHPNICCYPESVSFGSIKVRRSYAAVIYVTNTSLVPCRYRAVVPQPFKRFSSVRQSRHFLAPGLTEEVEVRINGEQPVGAMEMQLLVTHEGGSQTISVRWNSVEREVDVSLSSLVFLVGDTPEVFIPGVTTRFKRKNSDDVVFDEENEDDASSVEKSHSSVEPQ